MLVVLITPGHLTKTFSAPHPTNFNGDTGTNAYLKIYFKYLHCAKPVVLVVTETYTVLESMYLITLSAKYFLSAKSFKHPPKPNQDNHIKRSQTKQIKVKQKKLTKSLCRMLTRSKHKLVLFIKEFHV